jgi:hypothetical protein
MNLSNYTSNFMLIIISTLFTTNLYSQDHKKILQENAIKISNLEALNDSIYQAIKPYSIIMIGEMHGTKEPSEFALGLAALIAKKEGKVNLALEIPFSEINNTQNKITDKSLRLSTFFSAENIYGRNNQATFDLLLKSASTKGVKLHYIDNGSITPRDSAMYLEIKQIKMSEPNVKIITLTGNIHNRLVSNANKKKMGTYLLEDTLLPSSEKIMSINHEYNYGTMLNNTGQGLKLQTIELSESYYKSAINSKMFLCKAIFEGQMKYSHFLYTEQVTHASSLGKE